MNVLQISNLSFGYGKNIILKDISLVSKRGSITAILAPNGTGKTTLFHNILGILKPTKGSIKVGDKDILECNPANRAKYVAYVPQEWISPFNFSVLDVMLMGQTHKMSLFTSPTAQDEKKALEIMKEIDIFHLKHRNINELSGGQRQMVLLARALLQDTPLLLLDEPTSHLDIKNQALLFNELKNQVSKKSISVLINIHDPNLVSFYADEVYLLKEGKNFCHGSVSEVMNEKNLTELYDIQIKVGFANGRALIYAD